MKIGLKTELWKALHNPMFYAALILGCLISLVNVAENLITADQIKSIIFAEDHTGSQSPWGFSLFLLWMPVNGASYGRSLFYLVWPVLAAMPFGWSYLQERRGGLYNQLVSRMGRKSFYVAKYIAVFISGGLVVAVPVLFNLLVNATFCPYVLPNILNMLQIGDGYFLSELYFTVPWAYALIWCVVDFLLGGAAAGLCFVVGTRLRLQVMTILTPFALLLVADAVGTALRSQFGWNVELSPLQLAMAVPSRFNPEWVVGSVFLILAFLGFGIGYWQVVHHELA